MKPGAGAGKEGWRASSPRNKGAADLAEKDNYLYILFK